MKKVFHIKDCSKNEYDFLYKLYSKGKNECNIHNLSQVTNVPIEFKSLLSLGLKYCNTKKPNPKQIRKSVEETIRKLGWRIHFMINPSHKDLDELSKWHISCIKSYRNSNHILGPNNNISNEIADTDILCNEILHNVKFNYRHKTDLLHPTIVKLKSFCSDNNVIIIDADKNAGICVVNKNDYDQEVMRQLNDLNIFHPSTQSHFDYSMIQFKDRVKVFEKVLPNNMKLSRFHTPIDKPAKLRILPKVHKAFEHFPKGRPISSTVQKTNKYASQLLDFVLKPCMNSISDLIIDTQHLLLLLSNLKLCSHKKYVLVTIDVEALYPSLKLNDCKRHCLNTYCDYTQSLNTGFKLNRQQFLELMSLSLDFSFVEYEGNMYYQHQGIEMGNAASVAVANITVFHEISNLFTDNENIVFYKRFLDDLLLIVDLENITNIDDWLTSLLKHRYLKFTHEHNINSINFLDVQITLTDDNKINTNLYMKPMSKHLYLHSNSDHPTHLKNSLFFSQGLRIVRICSDFHERRKALYLLYNKFVSRDYTQYTLYPNLMKLIGTSRTSVLQPKKTLLCTYLAIHNPEILDTYQTTYNTDRNTNHTHSHNPNTLYAIFPFYKSIYKYKQILQSSILSHVKERSEPKYRVYVESLCIRIVFTRTKNLKEELKV